MEKTSESPQFEVRAITATGACLPVESFPVHADATDHAHRLLIEGHAVRVEVLRRYQGRAQLVGVIGQPSRSAPNPSRS